MHVAVIAWQARILLFTALACLAVAWRADVDWLTAAWRAAAGAGAAAWLSGWLLRVIADAATEGLLEAPPALAAAKPGLRSKP
jgi:hypothetical protein